MLTLITRRRIRRTGWATVVLGAVGLALAAAPTASAQDIQNPLDGVSPDFGLFSGSLDATWKRIVAFIWALIIIGSAVRVIVGAFKVKRAKSRGYANDLSEGSEELQDALISVALVAAASPLVATILFVVGG
ncbi:hypothetical protein DFR70_12761 [Nocardia tenerifensis]|uniref:DUF4134 domain-containing protein n=1 Tax=Nocardia tenerifensis TaxID=228006 RepID=A0A318JR53_9NOCA|nr:hypothetical protein [Nocardia tenerifensis]PXX53450.1 hypothetical protein DFR70_12761 [Nocardia tenerifensis]